MYLTKIAKSLYLNTRLKLVLLLVFLNFGSDLFAGNEIADSVFAVYEKEIDHLAKELSTIRFNEDLADSLSLYLLIRFQEILTKEGAFDYPFDSLTAIGKVQSDDANLRIFTWNIVRNNGTYTYYGLLQYYHKPDKEVKTYVLTDQSDSIPEPEYARLTHERWFGVLYYDLIETKLEDGNLYTLIGWDGNSLHTKKKVIESLTFTSSGKPKFGSSVFKYGRNKQKRVIFEYSRMANMMISYNKKEKMLFFDHLAPSDPVYENNVAYYGPDFSYDGFKFENYVWNFQSDVTFDNTREDNSSKKIKLNR